MFARHFKGTKKPGNGFTASRFDVWNAPFCTLKFVPDGEVTAVIETGGVISPASGATPGQGIDGSRSPGARPAQVVGLLVEGKSGGAGKRDVQTVKGGIGQAAAGCEVVKGIPVVAAERQFSDGQRRVVADVVLIVTPSKSVPDAHIKGMSSLTRAVAPSLREIISSSSFVRSSNHAV